MKEFNTTMARVCAELSARAYRECTVNGPRSTQVLVVEGEELEIKGLEEFQFVAFRGSQEILDFVTDGDVRMVQYGEGGVHRGFDRAFRGVEVGLISALDGRRPVVLTGHSLGGALAVMGGFHLGADAEIEAVYTFGQPRVGDGAFVRSYNADLGERTFRVVHEEDMVPRLPGVLMGFRHAGQEIFFNSAGQLVMNPTLVAKLVSDARGLCNEWSQWGPMGLAALLSDHGIEKYVAKIAALEAMNQKALEADRDFMTRRFSNEVRPEPGQRIQKQKEEL